MASERHGPQAVRQGGLPLFMALNSGYPPLVSVLFISIPRLERFWDRFIIFAEGNSNSGITTAKLTEAGGVTKTKQSEGN